MPAWKSRLKVWWMALRQVNTTRSAINTLEWQRQRIWVQIKKLQHDADEISIAQHRAPSENCEDLNLLWHSLRNQIKALEKEAEALAGQVAAYELFLIKVKHGLWSPLTGRKGSVTT